MVFSTKQKNTQRLAVRGHVPNMISIGNILSGLSTWIVGCVPLGWTAVTQPPAAERMEDEGQEPLASCILPQPPGRAHAESLAGPTHKHPCASLSLILDKLTRSVNGEKT